MISVQLLKTLVGFILLASIISCSFSAEQTIEMYAEIEGKEFDMIIVPGVPFENNEWGEIMKARVYWSKYLYDQGIARNVMYSGSAVYSPYYEAEIMGLYGEAIGIPRAHIYTEKRAEHSTENIYYSYKKARKLGFKKIALATDPYQAKLLKSYIKKRIDGDVAIIPIVYELLITIIPDTLPPEINYKTAFVPEFVSIKEREGIFKRMIGTWGNNVDSTVYDEILPIQ